MSDQRPEIIDCPKCGDKTMPKQWRLWNCAIDEWWVCPSCGHKTEDYDYDRMQREKPWKDCSHESKPIFPPLRPTEQEESPATVDDLAMLVKQLVRELKKYNLNDKLQARAMDYLKRKGLQGSPFSR